MNDKHNSQRQIQVRVTDDVARGRYANTLFVNNTKEEFMLDFGMYVPQQNQILISDRLFLSPAHTKRMIDVLQKQLSRYEQTFGTVDAGTDIAKNPSEIGYTVE